MKKEKRWKVLMLVLAGAALFTLAACGGGGGGFFGKTADDEGTVTVSPAGEIELIIDGSDDLTITFTSNIPEYGEVEVTGNEYYSKTITGLTAGTSYSWKATAVYSGDEHDGIAGFGNAGDEEDGELNIYVSVWS